MMTHRLVAFVSALVCAVSSQCLTQQSAERDTDFRVVLDRRTEKPAGFQASITTTSTYPCEGYALRTLVRWDKDTTTLHVLGLVRPAPCVLGSAEATGTAFIGEIKDTVSFFRIMYRGDVDLYKVVRLKGRIAASSVQRSFTELRIN